MPAQRDQPFVPVVIDDHAPHRFEGHAVEIAFLCQLQFAQVATQYGRTVAADIAHVAAFRLVRPGYAVEGVVLLTEKEAPRSGCGAQRAEYFRRIPVSAAACR